jgi:putative ABC transport system permease protein
MRPVWILHALLSHWRRRPFQAVTFCVGLAIATALWSGVQALNVEARASYDRAAAIIGGDGRQSIVTRGEQTISQGDYIALRRAGWPVSPVLDGDITIGDEADDDSSGDPLDFLLPPSLMLASRETVLALGQAGNDGGTDETSGDRGASLPPLQVSDRLGPQMLVTDIGVAQRVLERPGQLTRLVVTDRVHPGLPRLQTFGDGRLRLTEPQDSGDLERLTDSFHLNLTAFGFLAFLVGLFIVNAAVGLAFEQRRPMLRTMRACGVSARSLTTVMIAELVLLAAIAGAFGTVAGYLVASALLPDVAASLRGLYGADVAGELSLHPSWWLTGIAISVLGALAASATSLWRSWRLPLFATAQPEAWAAGQRRALRIQGLVGFALFVAAVLLGLFGEGLVAGFSLMGAILLGAALLLPVLLAVMLKCGERLANGPVASWFFADSRQQLGGLSLALMALLLALAVNIGVGTMVDSFRLTFTGWLDQRLASELYFGGDTEDEAAEIVEWLEGQDGVDAILPVWSADTRYRDWPVEVFGFRQHPTYSENWPLLSAAGDVWTEAGAGRALLVSEQMARRFELSVGDVVELPTDSGDWTLPVAGIYSDYGNPRGQVMVSVDDLVERFPNAERLRFAARVDTTRLPELMDAMRARFDFAPGQLVDQSSLKDFSQRVFERTFAVTLALNALTLAVAGVALLASLLSLAAIRLPQLAPLWALGLTRRRLATIELVRALALAVLTAIVALPLGLLVAWVLMNVVNVQAFGWRLPIHLFPMQWVQLFALAGLTALLAAAWPALKLRRMPPAQLLKVFADER